MSLKHCLTILSVGLSVSLGACEPSAETSTQTPTNTKPVAVPENVEAPGQKFEIRADALPEISKGTVNFMRPSPRSEADKLYVPQGFKAELFADNIESPRMLTVAPNGDVFVAVPASRFAKLEEPDIIWLLRDKDQDGVADERHVFARDLNMPMGLVVVDGALLVSDVDGIWRLPYVPGDNEAGERERLTEQNALGLKAGNHYHRMLALSKEGNQMFVAVGSLTNLKEEPLPHGTVQSFDASGGGQETFAAGLRNVTGIATHPDTGEIYTVVNERDGYGDDLVPDYFTRVSQGDFYGWPYSYAGGIPDPQFGDKRPDLVEATKMPDVLFQAHSAPIGLIFYTGSQFPAEYQGDAFVSFHGSWNRKVPTGYKVVRIPFENGRPVGGYENFLTGFLMDAEAEKPDSPKAIGRPAGLAQMPDGSLLLAEDGNNTIWRISYVGP